MTPRPAPGTAITPGNPVLAEVVGSGFTESRHRGAFVAVDFGGSVLLRAGTADVPIFPRSSNKPMQAAAMLRCGLDLAGKLLAVAAAMRRPRGGRGQRHRRLRGRPAFRTGRIGRPPGGLQMQAPGAKLEP